MTFTSRIDNNPLTPLFSLGELYLSNFVPMDDNTEYPKQELKLCLDEISGLVQLEQSPDFDLMYRNYWYNSGTNQSMIDALTDIVTSITKTVELESGYRWLDIASNDSTLLSKVPDNIVKIGCDPSNIAEKNRGKIDFLINDYFSEENMLGYGKFKVITAIAMFYDLDDPNSFLQDIYECLEDDGLFVIQMSYLPLMLKQLAFDNILMEHICYYSLTVLKKLYDEAGFRIVDVQINDVNGGSFRVYAQKDVAPINSFSTAPNRDVCSFRVISTLEYEKTLDLLNIETYKKFFENIQELKVTTVDFIKRSKAEGKTIYGYAASTKGNTLLQYFGLDNTLIDAIAERQSIKYGLKTVGTNIPIISEHEMRQRHPDYLLILPWHFIYEFKKRESEYLKKGGKFIVPCPKFEVI